ncbi:hypothetical protein SLS54_008262 [Diplodia seriata]
MRLNLPLLATTLAACESRDEMYKAREALCNTDKWKASSIFTWGWAVVNLVGRFHDQQSCWDGFENIIEQCYGVKDGGLVSGPV